MCRTGSVDPRAASTASIRSDLPRWRRFDGSDDQPQSPAQTTLKSVVRGRPQTRRCPRSQHTFEGPEPGHPRRQRPVPFAGRRERFDTEQTTIHVDYRSDIGVSTRTDPTHNQAQEIYERRRPPLSYLRGRHARPVKETSDRAAVTAATRVALRNGACRTPK